MIKKHFSGILVFTLLMTGWSLAAPCQIRQLPEVVKEAFNSKYPQATNVAYTDKLVEVDVQFVDSGYDCLARFTSKGEWMNTNREIKTGELPEQVMDGYNKSKYASSDWTLDHVYEVFIPDEVVRYKLVVEKNSLLRKNLLFSVEGRLLSDNLSF